jgi:putative SOS response-associated peptidase YedK
LDPLAVEAALGGTFGIRTFGRKSRYNIAPAQINPVVALGPDSAPDLFDMSWGMVPLWARGAKPSFAPINARSEDVLAKATFRNAVQQRRCAVPADGFYEWRTIGHGTKQPFFFSLRDAAVFWIAGIYEERADPRPPSYALLTTEPNELVARTHHRMPVILSGSQAKAWIEPGAMTPGILAKFTVPYPAKEMRSWPVAKWVNQAAIDAPECVEPISETEDAASPAPTDQPELF